MRVIKVPVIFLWPLALLCGVRACRDPRVQFSGLSRDQESYQYMKDYYVLQTQFGDRVDIFCSGANYRNLTIQLRFAFPKRASPGRQQKKVTNTTTLQLTLEKPEIGEYFYNCTDLETGCISYLAVKVRPIIIVKSRHIQQKEIENRIDYYVPIGEEYEVMCSGTKERELGISDGVNTIQTTSVNETTIKTLKLHEEMSLDKEFRCFELERIYDYASVSVNIDFNPAAINFWCVSDGLKVNCFWSVQGMAAAFKLFFTGRKGNLMLLCEDHPKRKRTGNCEWNIKQLTTRGYENIKNLTLVMQACNLFYCNNQTYFISYDSISKAVSPYDLRHLKISSHGASVIWTEYSVDIPVLYKLTYRLPGMPAQELDASSLRITCSSIQDFILAYNSCEANLRLPCPGTFYVIEVYTKLTTTSPTNDAYWSEPATTTFWTKPQNGTDAVDPACVKEPEPIVNKYIGLFEVQKLERSFHKDGLALRGKLKSMENKLDRIKALCHKLGLDDCKHIVMN